MTDNKNTWRERVTCYLEEYVVFDEGAYVSEGEIDDQAIKEAIALLIKNNVFDSAEELKLDVLREQNAIISGEYFEGKFYGRTKE